MIRSNSDGGRHWSTQANSESEKAIDALSSSVADLKTQRGPSTTPAAISPTPSTIRLPRARFDAQLAGAAAPVGEPGRSHGARAEIGRTRIVRPERDGTAAALPAPAPDAATVAPVALAAPSHWAGSARITTIPFLVVHTAAARAR